MEDTVHTFPGVVAHAGSAFHRRLEQNLQSAGLELSPEEAVILEHLNAHEGISQQALTARLSCHKTLITRRIDALESKNFVVRVPDKTDRRLKMIHLTSEGKAIFKQIQTVFNTTYDEALKGIKPEQIRVCMDVLAKLEANVADD